ncbi:MAG: DUF58 domain-containing protein [Micromonosporaceae bacterium]
MTATTGEAGSLLRVTRDNRLLLYSLVGLGSLAAALLLGRPALVALAAPFLLALVLGLGRTEPIRVRAEFTLDTEQVLEGDWVDGTVTLHWEGRLDVQLLLRELTGVEVPGSGLTGVEVPDSSTPCWSLTDAATPATVPVRLRATHWGRHTIGELWVRAYAPYGLTVWEGKLAGVAPTLRVLPSSERLTRLLDPAESRATAGVHRSRRIGAGSEFAELRPYAPGDRLRDLNWGATARHRRPYVNRHHPELSGEVVIVLDTYADDSTEVLARAARAAWSIASVHLQANDRVGVIGLGGRWRQLHPAGGRRAKYELMETLLGIGGDIADKSEGWYSTRLSVPESALVVALTPLYQRYMIKQLADWRARGRAVAVAMVDTRDLLPPPADAAERHARRLWSLDLERRCRGLADVGIPVVSLSDDSAGQAIAALRKARQAPMLRRGR